MKQAAVEWADLPADLLEFIHGKLENCREVIKLRSVCRWWRFSTPPPPNKISGLFPLRFSFRGKPDAGYDFVMKATAVYLLRRGPAAAWMVSVQEKSAGDLVLRHPLNYMEIPNKEIDSDWITASQTPISRSYAHNLLCTRTLCNRVALAFKVTFILETSSGSSELVGLCTDINLKLTAFRIELGETTTAVAASTSRYHNHGGESCFLDAVTFKSRIFAFDTRGLFYILDHKTLDLIQIGGAIPADHHYHFVRFVVSEGDLYLVVVSYRDDRLGCLIYRVQVVIMADESCEIRCEQVEELGEDTVFFVGMTDSFSVSARLLPPPWKGNCVVFGGLVCSMCGCAFFAGSFHDDPAVFFLGGGGGAHSYARFSSLPKGYSDLFSPPPTHLLYH